MKSSADVDDAAARATQATTSTPGAHRCGGLAYDTSTPGAMPLALPQPPFAPHSAPGILLVEHELNGARFVHSLIFDVLKADVWLWHEETLDPALRLLGAVQFKLILLDLNLPKVTARKAVRSVRKVAPRTPLVLLMRPEEFSPGIEPRVYQAEAVVPRGVGEPLMGIIRRLLQRG